MPANTVDIFFDFNPPIRMNTGTLVATLSTGMHRQHDALLQIYPNPDQGTFTLAMEGDALAELILIAPDGDRVLQHRVVVK